MRPLNAILCVMLAYAGVTAWVGLAVLSARALAPRHEAAAGWVAAAVAFVLLLSAVAQHDRMRAAAVWLLGLRVWRRSAGCLVAALLFGLMARLAWDFTFPAQASSDGATYLQLAAALSEGRPYSAGSTRAYWPPGYAIFLVPWLLAFDQVGTAVLLSNLFLFAVGVLGVWALAQALVGARSAALAALLYALWPNLVFQAGLPEKEQVLVALLPWALRAAIAAALAASGGAALAGALLSGLLIGACILVQPALLLFPAILVLAWLLACRSVLRAATVTLAFVVGAAAMILPWSLRNLEVLGQFVLVSTNGGIGLYGANNPRAGGGYFEHWAESDLLRLPELEADREGKRRAFEWIRTHPGDAITLAFEKNIRFMGDDAVGVFQTLRRGQVEASGATYAAFKGLSNLYWLACWTALLLLLGASWRSGVRWSPLEALVPATFVYGLALHSLAESAGKYHVLMTGVLCVLVVLLLEAAAKSQSTGTATLPAVARPLPAK